jgi:hypothetical protein
MHLQLNRKEAISAFIFWLSMTLFGVFAIFYEDALTKPKTPFFYIGSTVGVVFFSIQTAEWVRGIVASIGDKNIYVFGGFPYAVKISHIREVEQTDKEIFLHMVGGSKKRINIKYTTNNREFVNAILHRIQVEAFD